MEQPSELHVAAAATDLDAKKAGQHLTERLRRLNQEITAERQSGSAPAKLQAMSKLYHDLEAALGKLRFGGAGGIP